MMVLMIQPDIANIVILLIHQKSIFVAGLRVLSNPEIALCESGMERYTAESEIVVNDTTSERNGTCSMCGKRSKKRFLKQISSSLLNNSVYAHTHCRTELYIFIFCVHICCSRRTFCINPFGHGALPFLL